MSVLPSFLKGKATAKAEAAPVHCEHRELAPRWDNAADMGKRDRITHYRCSSCGATLSPDEAAKIASV